MEQRGLVQRKPKVGLKVKKVSQGTDEATPRVRISQRNLGRGYAAARKRNGRKAKARKCR